MEAEYIPSVIYHGTTTTTFFGLLSDVSVIVLDPRPVSNPTFIEDRPAGLASDVLGIHDKSKLP